MPAITALALVAILAVAVLSIAVHILFSPWLLLAVAVVAWVKLPAPPHTPVAPMPGVPAPRPRLGPKSLRLGERATDEPCRPDHECRTI